MKLALKIPLYITIVIGAVTNSYGQSKKTLESFPTYNQIKPASSEIMDYVPKDDKSGFMQQKVTLKLFDYPAGTVTYILNGQPTTDGAYAKKVISKAGNQITNMAIKGPTEEGKRLIYIDFTTNK